MTAFRAKPYAPALVAALTSAVAIALLYFFLPYASGYGDIRVTIIHFAQQVWGHGEDWQHCYLVPLAVGWLLYHDRKKLLTIEAKQSYLGLALLGFALFVYWVGFRADNIYLGYASFQLLVGGLILWLLGWKWMLGLSFAWVFLVFIYPLPFMDNLVAFRLRGVMATASVTVLNLIGIPSIQIGTGIQSAPDIVANLKTGQRFQVDVADPCSGIRSLFALMMVSALYAYLTQKELWKKVVLFLSSIPLAIAGNLVRILMLTIGTIIMGPEKAIGTIDEPTFFHMMAGYVVFVVALAGMLGVGALLNVDWRARFGRFRADLNTEPPPPPPKNADGKPAPRQDEY